MVAWYGGMVSRWHDLLRAVLHARPLHRVGGYIYIYITYKLSGLPFVQAVSIFCWDPNAWASFVVTFVIGLSIVCVGAKMYGRDACRDLLHRLRRHRTFSWWGKGGEVYRW